MKKVFVTVVLGLCTGLCAAFCQNPALARAALQIRDHTVKYDPAYFRIGYPGGDVPADRGVCTDVVIRAYRKLGIDLQKEVHEDMETHFAAYPKSWGLTRTDANIDHRRVPNLMTFFSRQGEVLKITDDPKDYKPGNIVCWDLGGGTLHIGIVTEVLPEKREPGATERFLIMHNIGGGQVLEDCLFRWKIIGHYRYEGKRNNSR